MHTIAKFGLSLGGIIALIIIFLILDLKYRFTNASDKSRFIEISALALFVVIEVIIFILGIGYNILPD